MKFNLDELLRFAVEKGASDVHITVGVPLYLGLMVSWLKSMTSNV